MSTFKRLMSMMLVLCMLLVAFASCTPSDDNNDDEGNGGEVAEAKVGNYTYNTYTTALGTNWNPHSWELNSDDAVLGYITSPFCTMSILDSENGVYQWVYEMAESITDVTADHQDDLTKYAVTLPEGQTVADTKSGYVYEIKLNPNAKWEDGTIINADSYIYSMKALLDPTMKNYRANLYYAGESAVAGGHEYYYSLDEGMYQSLLSQGFASVADAVAAGDVFIDVWNFWGANGYVDADGNACPQYVNVNDTVVYDTADAWSAGTPADAFSGADLFAGYGAYLEIGAGYDDYIVSWVVNESMGATFDVVGCYKVDDYTIRYVCDTYLELNYFLTSCTSTWLVYESLYEAGKSTTGDLVTTDYGTSIEKSMSYGPYKLESLQEEKQMVFVQNENWYGYEKQGDYLVSYTPYLVDGKNVQRYMATKVVIDVMESDAAKLAFLKGDIDDWAPEADDLITYSMSEQLYKVDETYTMSFFFNTGVDALKEMDNSKGNKNSVVLSNTNFRKAFSLSVDREEWVTATAGYKPAFSLMNTLYFYDVYNDPTSSYRGSDPAMQAICNLYGVQYGEGTPYATLKEAHDSINGYNLTEAKALMKTACDELVAAGLYTAGEEILIRVGYSKSALSSADNNQMALMNKYINAAAEGSGFGKITLEAVGSVDDRYSDVPAGNFAIGYGAWGGAAFYPFRNMQVYCDTEQYAGKINETGCWDPATETLTINIDGKDVTMTWQDWSRACSGTGAYAMADFETKLKITAVMEEEFLKKYYRIPFAGSTACSMLSYKLNYYTDEYNIMYGFGGLELINFNYTDEEWTAFVAENNGQLNYE